MKTVYLMCGPAGAGKSTWIKNDIESNNAVLAEIGEAADSIWISRDQIRFSIVPEDAPYFSQENRVFHMWIDKINSAIKNPTYNHIYVDATHISKTSRNKTLSNLNLDGIKVIAVNILTDEETVVRQNAKRSGRELVPEATVRNMCSNFVPATTKENFIDFVLNIERGE